jgi:hypothetical protein
VKVGDLVKPSVQGVRHPHFGIIIQLVKDNGRDYFQVSWDLPDWEPSLWRKHELEVISEGG